MTVMLTRSPAKTLLLQLPPWHDGAGGAALAVAMHPLASLLQERRAAALSGRASRCQQLAEHACSGDSADCWLLLLVIAVVPAVCEELAFRGFILSGFRHLGHKWRAIILDQHLFRRDPPVLQQSLVASLLGVVLGYLAVQSGSILPGMVFHVVHNSLAVLVPQQIPAWLPSHPGLTWVVSSAEEGQCQFTPLSLVLSAALSIAILVWLGRLPYARTKEESLQEAIEHQTAQSPA